MNDPYGAPNTTAGAVGDPSTTPFTWLTWNNRPFVSQLELPLAPWNKSSRLLSSYGGLAPTGNPYADSATPFPRNLSFLQSEQSATPGTASLLYRLLDFVNVPSRFVGTDIQVDPATAAAATNHWFHPPFNRIPTYREPGKINVNTIYNQEVFNALMNGVSGAAWNSFVPSRRGYPTTNNNVLDIDPNAAFPTEFGRPFRSFAGGSMVPAVASGGNTDILRPTREVDATVLPSDPLGTGTQPLFNFTSANVYNDSSRNPFFYYQGLQRLGNLVTTRSNVYAVWITVGYFEVTPVAAPDTTRWPDGYQLGQELGSDTGEIQRHRAFYIFDRTIPVGFQRGQDLNVEKAILVKRFIE